jgi:L-arabinose transport system permease protein
MLVVFLVLFCAASLLVENFFTWRNVVMSLGLSVTTVGIIACTMLFCLAAGEFDLSVGSTVALAGVLAATLTNLSGHVAVGLAGGVLAGGAVGLLNGVVIARLGVNALIATLATMQIVRGLGLMVSGGSAVGVSNEGFYTLGNSRLLLPTPVWILIGALVVFGLLLHRTTFGRNALAIGGNAEAARLAGIGVTRIKITIFVLQGLMAGFAGVISASQMTSGQPNTAQGLELRVISACVLGGVSLAGGVGSILNVVVGVLIMGTVQNVMDLLNVPTFYQYVASGAILLAAVLLDRIKQAPIH